jgi:hypothetical protein
MAAYANGQRVTTAEFELVANDIDQPLGSTEVLGATATGVFDDSGQLECLVVGWNEDPNDERLHAAIVVPLLSVALRRPKGRVA